MTTFFSATLLHRQQLLLVAGFILGLFSGCQLSKKEISDPNYNPYVLEQGTYVKAKGIEVKMDSMVPPDTITVKGQRYEAKRLMPRKLKSEYIEVSKQEPYPTAPVSLKMSEYKEPIFIPSEGVKQAITLPPGIPVRISVESTDNYYIGLLTKKLGLNSNRINVLIEDSYGRIWIGTDLGVSFWDGSTLFNLSHQDGLPEAFVIDILEDSSQNIWISFADQELIKWNGEEFISYSTLQGLSNNVVTCLMEDSSGKIWIGTANGLNIWDGTGFLQYHTEQGLSHPNVRDIAEDQNGDIWIGTWGGGVNIWDGKGFSRLTTKEGLSNDFIVQVLPDSGGNVWLSTAGSGLNKWDGRRISYFTDIGERCSIGFANEMIEDSNGKIWIGGNAGVDIYDGNGFTTILKEDVLSITVVVSLLEDSSGRKWVGTAGGGLYILVAPDTKHYATDEKLWYHSGYLDLLEDSNGDIWVQSEKLGLIPSKDPDTEHLLSIRNDDANVTLYQDSYKNLIIGSRGIKIFEPGQLGKETPEYFYYKFNSTVIAEVFLIHAILEDHSRNIWLGGNQYNGVLFWNRSIASDTDSLQFLQYSFDQGLDAWFVTSLLQDKQGKIWIGSVSGISLWDGIKFTKFTDKNGLSANNISDLTIDPEGNIWIATKGGGINVWDGQGFLQYTRKHGLPTNNIESLRFDKNDNLWVGTDEGLMKLWIGANGKIYFEKYNEYQGVGRAFISKALIDRNNRLWAISQSNLDMIGMKPRSQNNIKPRLSILQVQPFFDQFDWRRVRQSLSEGEKLVTGNQELSLAKVKYDSVYRFTNLPVAPEFPYNINNLSFQWSSTYWADPTSIQYSYFLEGQDLAWSPLIKDSKISFNNIRPGKYNLKVRAVAGNANWSDAASYSFTIRPPLWATWWAYGLYALCAVGLVLALRHYEKKRFMLTQRAQSLEEIDKAKTEFFTNISHELRTPLTLILGPLKALEQGTYKGDRESLFSIMSQNGRSLLRLVNQLLDLSKLDQGKLKLELSDCNLNELAGQVLANFDSACSLKEVELEYHKISDSIYCRVDEEKIRQVIYNLVSNAIKFTPAHGHILVSVNSLEPACRPGRQEYTGDQLKIVVKDSGIGIPKEEMDYIFDRFYQVKNAHQAESQGTGIGLALTKKLVELHQGTIMVESEPGWGSTFTVTLPLIKAEKELEAIVNTKLVIDSGPGTKFVDLIHTPADALWATTGRHTHTQSTQTSNHKPILLLVEDNAQMRQYVITCLGEGYHYLEATDGEQGLRLALDQLPDLILCDVVMPKMHGYEFCSNLRGQTVTAHIPFIFLTAKADLDSRLQGLEIGSNDYVTKPFEPDELRLKIRNHLDRIQRYRQFFSKQLAINGEIDPVQSLDSVFLNKAIEAVQDQLDNHEFSVLEFSRLVGLSHAQLYRKLMALTGQSPSIFIRSIRLKKAAQLIVQDYGNTSDVAYAVGFNNLSYFAKCFKEQFGISPSAYGKKSIHN